MITNRGHVRCTKRVIMKTLTLKMETIRTLSSSELDIAHGGGMQALITSSARKPEEPVSSAKPAPQPEKHHHHWSFSSVRRWL